jgi:hypothetical protein
VNVLVVTVNVVEGISIANATQSYLASNVLVLWAVADGAKAQAVAGTTRITKAIMALESVFLRTGILLTLPHVRQPGIAMVDTGCAGANCVMAARNSPWAVR